MKTRKFTLKFKSVHSGDIIAFNLYRKDLSRIAHEWLDCRALQMVNIPEAYNAIFDLYVCALSWDEALIEYGYHIQNIVNQKEFENWIYQVVVAEYLAVLKDQYL